MIVFVKQIVIICRLFKGNSSCQLISKLSALKYLKIYKVGTLCKPYRYLIKTMQWFTKGMYYLNTALK